MTKSTLGAKYRSLIVRKSHKKTIVPATHKMIRLIYLLLSHREPSLDQAIDLRGHEPQEERPTLDQAAQGHRPVVRA